WLSLMRIELPMPSAMPRAKILGFVTKMSSPTNCMPPSGVETPDEPCAFTSELKLRPPKLLALPSSRVRIFQPSQSSSDMPSSSETMGYWRTQFSQKATICSDVRADLSDFLKIYFLLALSYNSLA